MTARFRVFVTACFSRRVVVFLDLLFVGIGHHDLVQLQHHQEHEALKLDSWYGWLVRVHLRDQTKIPRFLVAQCCCSLPLPFLMSATLKILLDFCVHCEQRDLCFLYLLVAYRVGMLS